MGSFKHPHAFDPLDLEIIDRVYEAAWAQIEARESDRDTRRDADLAGRTGEEGGGFRPDEGIFRETAHGFLAWALAILIVVSLLTVGSLTAAAAAPPTGSVAPE